MNAQHTERGQRPSALGAERDVYNLLTTFFRFCLWKSAGSDWGSCYLGATRHCATCNDEGYDCYRQAFAISRVVIEEVCEGRANSDNKKKD